MEKLAGKSSSMTEILGVEFDTTGLMNFISHGVQKSKNDRKAYAKGLTDLEREINEMNIE